MLTGEDPQFQRKEQIKRREAGKRRRWIQKLLGQVTSWLHISRNALLGHIRMIQGEASQVKYNGSLVEETPSVTHTHSTECAMQTPKILSVCYPRQQKFCTPTLHDTRKVLLAPILELLPVPDPIWQQNPLSYSIVLSLSALLSLVFPAMTGSRGTRNPTSTPHFCPMWWHDDWKGRFLDL